MHLGVFSAVWTLQPGVSLLHRFVVSQILADAEAVENMAATVVRGCKTAHADCANILIELEGSCATAGLFWFVLVDDAASVGS